MPRKTKHYNNCIEQQSDNRSISAHWGRERKPAACGHNEKTLESKNSNNGNQESETIRQSPICIGYPAWRESWLEMSPSTWATLLKCPPAKHWHGAAFVPVPRPPCERDTVLLQYWLILVDNFWNADLFANNKRTNTEKFHTTLKKTKKKQPDSWALFVWLINWVTSFIITDISTYMACSAGSNPATKAVAYFIYTVLTRKMYRSGSCILSNKLYGFQYKWHF